MRCRRNKEIKAEYEFRQLDSNFEVGRLITYYLLKDTDLCNVFDDSTMGITVSIEPVTFKLHIEAEQIIYNNTTYTDELDVEIECSSIHVFAMPGHEDVSLNFFDRLTNKFITFINPTLIQLKEMTTLTYLVEVAYLKSDAYQYLYEKLGRPAFRGLAFFGSYGSYEDFKEESDAIANGIKIERTVNYPASSDYGYMFYHKCYTSVVISTPSNVNAKVVIYTSTNTYYYHSLTNTNTTTFNYVNSKEGWIDVRVIPSDDASIEACKNAMITYIRPIHKAIKTEDGETFAKEQEGVACSLTQRLSLIKGELWYQINTGLPLFEKGVSSTTLDSWILKTIQQHPDVVSIESFESQTNKTQYHCNVDVMTRWGKIEISI